MNPHQVTRDFEAALCAYTGAPYAVAVNSCTMALLLSVAWHTKLDREQLAIIGRIPITIPRRTYISVPMSIIHGDGWPAFREEDWQGWYRLSPFRIWDSARFFSSGMYKTITHFNPSTYTSGGMVCVSFHASKTLGLEQGGAILHDNPDADAWLRRARFDGRTEGVAPKDDRFDMVGWHCYMNPSTAALGLLRLHSLPKHNAPLPNDDYPDLSQLEIFK